MSNYLKSVSTFLLESPSERAILSCFSRIHPLFETIEKAELLGFFSECKRLLTSHLNIFNQNIYESLGFRGFTEEDVANYYCDISKFSCNLNKDKGKGILYGLKHARDRRYIVNGFSRDLRLRLLMPKLRHINVFDNLESPLYFGHQKSDDYLLSQIMDITDIGMGHSVYLVSLPDAQWVVKKRENNHQTFYTGLLALFEKASMVTYNYFYNDTFWEISEYWVERVLKDGIFGYFLSYLI